MKNIILITFIFFIIMISCQDIDYGEDKKEKCIQLENKLKSSILNLSIIEKLNLGKEFAEECILTTEASKNQNDKIRKSLQEKDEIRRKEKQAIIDRINRGECISCKNDFGEDTCMKVILNDPFCPRKEFKNCVTTQECTSGICKDGFCIGASDEDRKKDISWQDLGHSRLGN